MLNLRKSSLEALTDHPQFGRDILFVTTHLSSKLCDNTTALQHRHYTEIEVGTAVGIFQL